MKDETRIEHWRRFWHLYRYDVKLWVLGCVVGGAVLALLSLAHQAFTGAITRAGSSRWWNAIPGGTRYLILGSGFELFGILFLLTRIRKGRKIRGFLDFRVFMGQIVMIVLGFFFLIKAWWA